MSQTPESNDNAIDQPADGPDAEEMAAVRDFLTALGVPEDQIEAAISRGGIQDPNGKDALDTLTAPDENGIYPKPPGIQGMWAVQIKYASDGEGHEGIEIETSVAPWTDPKKLSTVQILGALHETVRAFEKTRDAGRLTEMFDPHGDDIDISGPEPVDEPRPGEADEGIADPDGVDDSV